MPAASDPDVALLLRVKSRDPDALAALYARFARPLFRFLLDRTGGRREAAEDLLQETFLRVWRAAPSYAPSAAATTWLFTIARNAAINAHAREQGRSAAAGDPDLRSGTGPRGADAPESALAAEERAAAVRRAVDGLPPGERDVVRLAVFERRRYADVARALGIPEGTVKSRMASALGRLRGAIRLA